MTLLTSVLIACPNYIRKNKKLLKISHFYGYTLSREGGGEGLINMDSDSGMR